LSGAPLADGYYDVAPGKLATVVTFLEMLRLPDLAAERSGAASGLRRVRDAEPAWYRDLFRRVGGDYLWTSRLTLDDAGLRAALSGPRVELYALEAGGADEGILELDFHVAGECEIAFFGVTRKLVGSGAGSWLMRRAIDIAWQRAIRRFWLHTCDLDHPSALGFYRKFGFVPYARQVEIFDDPRAFGLLPRDSAPNVLLFESKGHA
jgi:GNAT superfamily N-acetyltransferase